MSSSLVLFSLFLTYALASPFPAQRPNPPTLFATPQLNSSSPSNPSIKCLPPRPDRQVDLGACALILDRLRTYPNYGREQIFREGVRPLIEPRNPASVPPFMWFSPRDREGKCAIVVHEALENAVDVFSWERVVVIVSAILTVCQREGSGGYSVVGRRGFWEVRVSTYEP